MNTSKAPFWMSVGMVVAALATSSHLTAQDAAMPVFAPMHHHYKLIDMSTFGGPNGRFNSLSLTDGFGFGTVFYNNALIGNGQGVFVGFADTYAQDPYPEFCYAPDCFVAHAFKWGNGVTTDLGALPGGASSAAFWINQSGWITGNSENGQTDPLIPGLPEIRAVLWKDGSIQDLGTLGGSTSFAQAINNSGQITGLALNGVTDPYSFYYNFLYGFPNGTQTRAFLWDEQAGMQDLGTLGGPDAFPSVINQHGKVAGFSYTNSTPNPTTGLPTYHPFLWEKGKGMKDLGDLGGTLTASVNGLNELGEVVGGASLPGDVLSHPFLWDGQEMIDLTIPPFDPSQNGEARWINDAGDVVGSAGLPIPCDGNGMQGHGFLWSHGTITDLGGLPGTPNSEAQFINSATQIVGESYACDRSAVVAFLWENGSIVDLNTLISGNSQFFLYWSTFISNNGEIAAYGSLANGDSHAVLLIPCDGNHPGVAGCDYTLVDANSTANISDPPYVIPNTSNTPLIEPLKKQGGGGGSGHSSAAAPSGPSASLSPAKLYFICRGLIDVGVVCLNERTTTLSNTGTANLNINNISTTGAFTQTNDCGTTLGPGQSCTISVHWSQTSSAGFAEVSDNAPKSPQTVSLSGVCPYTNCALLR